jgi:DNA-binding beta-propeller fold protein YncE
MGRIYVAKCTAEQIAVVQPGETISAIIDTPATQLPQWGPEAVAFDPQTKRLFSVETNGDVTIIDATTNTIIKKRTFGEGGGWPMTASIAVDQVGRRVISTIRLGTLKRLVVPDADSLAVADTYKDGGDILGMAANDKTHIAYTGSTTFNADNARQGALLGIDLLNNKKFTAISGLSDGPANFVADPRTNLLYAAAASEGASVRDRYAGRKSSLRRSMFPQRRSLAISSCWIQRTMGSISPPKDCF